MNPPIYDCGNCKECGSRWHLTEYCPYKDKVDLIIINEDGDALRTYPESDMADNRLLAHCIATHHICGGCVDLRESTPTKNAMTCRACNLRVTVPNTVETFGDLRSYFQRLLDQPPANQRVWQSR